MKRSSELHERIVNSKKRSHCHLFLRRMEEIISVEDLRQSQNQSRHHKRYIFERALHIEGTYFHAFRTSDQIGHLHGAPKIKIA